MIELKNVCKNFEQKEIFKDFSYKFNPGEITVIMGPSGCGKSTLLNMIGGLEKKNSGEILIDNKSIEKYKDNTIFRDKISYLFQNFALIETKTILDNLKIALGKNLDLNQVKSLMKELNLNLDIKTPVYMLSGGEQQRVSMLRILLKDNPIILADEPTGSLDQVNRDIILDLLKQQKAKNKTIIIVTHDPEVTKIADKIIKL